MNEPDNFPSPVPITPKTFAWRLRNRPVNYVEGYDHGSNAKRYLRQCAERSGLYLEEPERDEPTLAAMAAAGYAAWDKFTRHLLAWHTLGRPVPRSYASFIGVRQPALLAAVEADRQEHERALATAPILCSWVLRRMAGIYELQAFPAECESELDCIVFCGASCVRHGFCTSIHIPGVKSLWFTPPHGEVQITLYTPGVKFSRAQITFADDGRNEGTMRLA